MEKCSNEIMELEKLLLDLIPPIRPNKIVNRTAFEKCENLLERIKKQIENDDIISISLAHTIYFLYSQINSQIHYCSHQDLLVSAWGGLETKIYDAFAYPFSIHDDLLDNVEFSELELLIIRSLLYMETKKLVPIKLFRKLLDEIQSLEKKAASSKLISKTLFAKLLFMLKFFTEMPKYCKEPTEPLFQAAIEVSTAINKIFDY